MLGPAQLFGLMTQPLIKILLPHPKHQSRSMTISSDPTTPKSFTIPLLGEGQDSLDDLGGHDIDHPSSIRSLLTTPTHTVHHYWRKFDDAFMRPMFGGRGFVPFVPGSPTERNSPNQWHWKRKRFKMYKRCKVVSITKTMKLCTSLNLPLKILTRFWHSCSEAVCILFCN